MADETGSLVVRLAMNDASFQEGIQRLNREMKLVDSEFKKVMSSSVQFGNSLDGLKAKSQYLAENINIQEKVMEKYQQALRKSSENLASITRKQEELNSKLNSAKSAYENSANQLGKNSEETKKLKTEYEQLSKEYTQNEKKIRTYVKQIDNHNIAINKAQTNVNKYKQELIGVQSEITKASSGFAKFQKSINELGSSMSSIGQSMVDIGKNITTRISAPLAVASGAIVKTGADFEQSMAKVGAISGETGQNFEALVDKAREMGATTVFSASDSAEALQYMAMAGWKAQDMVDGLEGVMNLAAASGENLGTVSDIVTDGLTAFGLSAKESGKFADILAAASSNSNTNVAMMGETFSYVAPIAGALGFSMEDTAVAIGLMANSGIKASQAGTSLRQIVMGLQGDTEVVAESFGKMVIHVTNTDGTMKSFREVILQLRDAFSQMTQEEKAMNAEAIAGKVGMSGLLAIVNAGEKDFVKLANAVDSSNGVAKEMSQTMVDTVSGSFKIFLSACEELSLQIFDRFEPALRGIIENMTQMVESFMAAPEWIQNVTIALGGILVVAGPLLTILGAMVKSIGGLFQSFSGFKALLSPTGLALTALAATIGVIVGQVVQYQTKQKALNDELNKTLDIKAKGVEANEQSIEQAQDEMALLVKQVDAYESLESQHKNNVKSMEDLAEAMQDASEAGDYKKVEELGTQYNALQEETRQLTTKMLDMAKNFEKQNMTVDMAKDRIGVYKDAIKQAEADVKLLNATTDKNAKVMAEEAVSLNNTARQGKILSNEYVQLTQKQNLTAQESSRLKQVKEQLIGLFGRSIEVIDQETGVSKINVVALNGEITTTQQLANAKISAVNACNQGSVARLKAQKAETEGTIKLLRAQLKTYQYVEDIMQTRQEIVDYEGQLAQIDALLSGIEQTALETSNAIQGSSASVDKAITDTSDKATKKTKEAQKTQLEIAMETYERKREMGQLSFEQEIQMLDEMRNKHAKNSDEIIQINEYAQNRIKELVDLKKQTDDLSLQEEISLYERAKQQYCKTQEDKLEFNKLINQAIVEDALSVTENMSEMSAQEIQLAKEALEEKKIVYKDNKYVVEEIDKEILETKKALYDEEVRELGETVDLLIAERKRQYDEELALIDTEANQDIQKYQDRLDEIERLEEEQRKKDKEASYEEKLARLQDKLEEAEDYEERQKIREDIRKTELEREKWYLDEKRKEEKESLKESIREVKENANDKKQELKKQFDEEKAAMEEHKLFQQEWLRQKMLDTTGNEQQITQNTLQELKNRESNLETSMINQMNVYKGQIPQIQQVGNEYGEKLLLGIQSTEQAINAYMERKIRELKDRINSVQFGNTSTSSNANGRSMNIQQRSVPVESKSLFDLKSFTTQSEQNMKNMLTSSTDIHSKKVQQNTIIKQETKEVKLDVNTSKIESLLETLNNKLDRLPKNLRQEVRMG